MSFVAIDWGSTHVRLWQLNQGTLLDYVTHPLGVKQIAATEFEAVFLRLIAPWRDWIETHQIPVLLAGMVGSDAGWIDAGYQYLPLSVEQIAKGSLPVSSQLGAPVWLHPGLACLPPEQANILRGEEVQFLGALAQQEASDIYLFPGTHSKWLSLSTLDGVPTLQRFTTALTGELYQLLLQHSLLGQHLPKASFSLTCFLQGVTEARHSPATLLLQLFSARSQRVLGLMPAEEVASWLSGLLIGNELMQLKTQQPSLNHLTLVGDPPLTHYYQQAAESLGFTTVLIDGEMATLQGFRRIYDAL